MKYYKHLLILSFVFFAFTTLFSCSSNRDDNNNVNNRSVDIVTYTELPDKPYLLLGKDFSIETKGKWEKKGILLGNNVDPFNLQVRYPNGNLNADYVIILEMYENGKQIYRIGGKGKIDLELKEGNISLKSNYILPK
ncbi:MULTISPECIES: hypothetical protein [Elizabethkingia]|uniref:hypothetical protein n=1 Tax=Elizabethkingia TaxID=308865 RepID=UPI0010C1A2A9|nr:MULTISPECIES: hypothetical protein [Elizabethkingia]QCO45800.1 hypothetical protein FCS00_05230 [Elizabethkingia sp. 2-6]WQM37660.1 hypothetical protein U2S95_14970 [Elizabethkingia miricola]